MAIEEQKRRIVAAINARGWFTTEVFRKAACELCDAGLIKQSEKFTVGGNRKSVWVAA